MAGPGRQVWPAQATKLKKGGRLFLVGVDAAKESIYSRLQLDSPGPGYCHFPVGRDGSYFEGLSSETAYTEVGKNNFPVRKWKKKTGHARNEPLDCRVYAYAALCSMSVKWDRLKARIDRKSAAKRPETPEVVEPKAIKVEERPKETRKSLVPRMPGYRWTTSW
jgi:phage terminase large subunit GpA-like protein